MNKTDPEDSAFLRLAPGASAETQGQKMQRLGIILISLLLADAAQAELLRIDSAVEWQAWTLPGDAVEIEADALLPRRVRRNTDAVLDAELFGGGIRAAGTNAVQARNLIDGNPQTTWTPDINDALEDWYIEVNLGSVVSARRIVLHFDKDAPALEFFRIFASNGEEFFSTSGTTIAGSVRYEDSWRYSFNTAHEIEIDFGLRPLQFVRIQAERQTAGSALAGLAVESVGDNIALGLVERGGSASILNEIVGAKEGYESSGKSLTLVDGDIKSNWTYKGASAPGDTEFRLDLGAVYWVDRVRLLGDLVGLPPNAIEIARTRRGAINYSWYKLWGSDGSLAPDGSLRWAPLGELPADPRNWRDIVHFEERFALQRIRHLRLRFGNDGCCLSGTTAEFQVFGEGYPAQLLALSPVYDLGGDKNIAELRWQADTPPGTHLQIRTRSGNELVEQYVFHDKSGKEVTPARYEKLIPSFRGRIDTLRTPGADWSLWSRAYDDVPNHPFLSPVPRRFVQIQAAFFSEDPLRAVRLDAVELEFDEPLAAATRGEIYPVSAQPGQPTNFTYFIRPSFRSGNLGFDQLLLSSSAPIHFHELRIDGQSTDVTSTEDAQGLRLHLAQKQQSNDLIEVDFTSTIFTNQTRFDAFLLNLDTGLEVRQQVDAGDSAADIASGVLAVSLPAHVPILNNITLSSPIITPNGDGIHDQLTLSLNVLRLLEPRVLRAELLDLSGRRLRLLTHRPITAGRVVIEWDGHSDAGQLVTPGLYLLYLTIEGDAETARATRTLGIAY